MATQTATPPLAPSAKVVGNAFVEQYYSILHSSPEMAYKFYKDSSILSRPDHNGVLTSVTTMESINHEICSLDYKNCKAEIKTADAQDSYYGGVIVLVTGSLTGKDNRTRTFTQTFFLAPQEKGYFVLNDVLRYVEACEPSKNAEITVTAPPHAINPKKLDRAISHEAGSPNVHEHFEEDRQDNNWEEIGVDADPHLSDKLYSTDLESSIAALDDAPKKSYASIVGSETRKGQIEVYVPEVPPLVKTEKQVGDSVVTPEALPPATGNFILSDSKASEDEAEGYSIYIRHLPPNLTVDQLETEFKRFGPIKQNGVQVRSNRQQGFCFGFVEFEELSSMQSAIQASPIIFGTHEAIVEMKRTKRRGSGENSSYFGAQRIMDRSDSFRGRGNFNGGRGGGYGRSNFGNRMDFSGKPRNRSNEFRGRGRGGGHGGES